LKTRINLQLLKNRGAWGISIMHAIAHQVTFTKDVECGFVICVALCFTFRGGASQRPSLQALDKK